MLALRRIIAKLLRETADKIDAGTCELSEQEAVEIMSAISHRVLSKEQACEFLNLQRSRFDDLVREGRIPRGRKRRGFKELIWYEDELRQYVMSLT
jgi:predicted DNA-binding transcriptional regulator AlpA